MAAHYKSRLIKTFTQLSFAGILLSILTACSGIPVSQDFTDRNDLTNYQTYQWLPANMQSEPKAQQLKTQKPFIAQRIETAILNNLHKRGALIDRNQAQAYISYHYSISKTQVVTPSTSVGFGWFGRNVGIGTRVPLGYDTDIYYDVKWQVDIYNANGKLIWTGESIRPLKEFETPEEAQTYTQEVIDAIMAQYPPKQ
ncbi:DUF4136 domain-containing protein [Thiomicrorhabdus hydrogeniphila]